MRLCGEVKTGGALLGGQTPANGLRSLCRSKRLGPKRLLEQRHLLFTSQACSTASQMDGIFLLLHSLNLELLLLSSVFHDSERNTNAIGIGGKYILFFAGYIHFQLSPYTCNCFSTLKQI